MEQIDRIAPTRRPSGRPVQKQHWAELGFLHWRVPVAALRPLIPAALEIDTYDGEAWVGVVPFTMTGVRPVWAPAIRAISDFHEINVRTYVHREGRDPGVWFFSLDAANSLAVRIARAVWRLPYHKARMSLEKRNDGAIEYRSERLWPGPTPARCSLRYKPVSDVAPAVPGTLEHFLAERYVLYAAQRSGSGLYLGRVHHTAYPLQRAEVSDLDESLLAAAGITRPDTPPLAHFASAVDVDVFALAKL